MYFKLARTQILRNIGKAVIKKICVCNKLLLLLLTDRHRNSSNTINLYVGIKTDTATYDVHMYVFRYLI